MPEMQSMNRTDGFDPAKKALMTSTQSLSLTGGSRARARAMQFGPRTWWIVDDHRDIKSPLKVLNLFISED